VKRFILLPLFLLLGLAQPASAQFSRIISIQLVNNNNTVAQSFQSNFSLKVGANCTWSVTGTTATMNCAGGGGGTPAGNTGEVQTNAGGGMFGAITGLTNGLAVNCDGFMDNCQLLSSVPTGTSGVPYTLARTVTGGPAGNYTTLTTFDSDANTHVQELLDAYDGTNYAFMRVNSLTGFYAEPTVSSRLFTYVPLSGGVVCPTANICEHAPTSGTTKYEVTKPKIAAQGTWFGRLEAGPVITQSFSGDAEHSAVVNIGSDASIGSTQLCGTSICIAGTYRVNAYLDITTACGTTGTYLVNLIYTDDQGSKTIPVNLNGTGSIPATGVVTTTSTSNFGQEAQIIRSTGAVSINYSTTAVACGSAGPMVGKLYLSVEAVQ
jgi:hypothetical protein